MATWAKRAVIVVHGIGVQRRNSTLDSVTRGFERVGCEIGDALHETAPFGQPLPATAMRISRNGDRADVYEVYWAPHTAHRTSARKVLKWLLKTTYLPGQALKRPSPKTLFDVAVASGALIAAVVVILMALSSIGTLTAQAGCTVRGDAACGVPFIERGLDGKNVTAGGLRQLTVSATTLWDSIDVFDRPLSELSPGKAADVLQSVSLYTWLFLAGVIFITSQALYRLQQLLLGSGKRWLQLAVFGALVLALTIVVQPVPPVLVAFGWILAIVGALARGAANFLAESVGDVQVYVERDENSGNFAARERVVAEAEQVLELVGRREYEEIVIMGHSLGSVIALDALRRLRLRNPAMTWQIDTFVTFGTAIEKVRYFFERKNGDGDIEQSAQRRLKRAVHAVVGQCAWLNLWYWNDVVADPITSFQGEAVPNRQRWSADLDLQEILRQARAELVVNLSFGAPLTPAPIWTHSRYWNDDRVLAILADIALPGVTAASALAQQAVEAPEIRLDEAPLVSS